MSVQSPAPVSSPAPAQNSQQAAPMPEARPVLKDVEISADGAKAISEEAVQKQLDNINKMLAAKNTNVSLEYDHLSSPKFVNLIDSESGKVIKQFPPQAVVEIAEKSKDYIIGLMIDKAI